MRKIKYLLALAALLLCVPVLAAETPRLKIEVPGQNVKPQEEFAVTLSLHDIRSIAALGFHISYDKTRLELLECEMAPEGFNLYINKENGKAVFVGAADYIEDGTLLNLRFKVLENAEDGLAEITLAVQEALNVSENKVILQRHLRRGPGRYPRPWRCK